MQYPESDELPNRLKFLVQKTLSTDKCKQLYTRRVDRISDNNLCAIGKEKLSGACHGDSGGPVVDITNPDLDNQSLVGIVSWGIAVIY